MKIALVISSLGCGGAERVLTLMAESFLKRGHEVAVITISAKENDFYKLPDGISRLPLNIQNNSPTIINALWNNVNRLLVLRRAIHSIEPDVIISFLNRTNIRTLLALTQTKYPVILSEHNDPGSESIGKVWHKLRRFTYPYASQVVSVSKGIDRFFEWLPKTKRTVIYNPLTIIQDNQEIINIPPGADPNKKWIVSMGRLTHQKGFDILLKAFHSIYNKYPDWQLLVLGEGELRSELEILRTNLGLTKCVILPGKLSNPFPLLKTSNLFVFSSRHEGFGLALIEAMACGLPVISTDCPSGPSEIIRDGVDGILVPNENMSALAAAMDRLISDEPERKRLASRAPEVQERFSLDKAMGMWEELINKVIR